MYLAEMTWPEIKALTPHTPVIVPVAAVEQHGHHLPVATDSLLLGEVVRRVEARVPQQVLFAPLMWLGNSHHHLEYAGTLSASPRVYLELLNDLIENLLQHGFQRVVFLNGHGGNITPFKQAIFEARQRHRTRRDLLLLGASYWDFAQPAQMRHDLHQDIVGHACEWETSMVLAIRPELVKEYRSLPEMDRRFWFEPAYRGWITQERAPQGVEAPGHLGIPHQASAEKGEFLFEAFTTGFVSYIERVVGWDGHSWEVPV